MRDGEVRTLAQMFDRRQYDDGPEHASGLSVGSGVALVQGLPRVAEGLQPLIRRTAAAHDEVGQQGLGGTAGDLHPTPTLGLASFTGHGVRIWLVFRGIHSLMVRGTHAAVNHGNLSVTGCDDGAQHRIGEQQVSQSRALVERQYDTRRPEPRAGLPTSHQSAQRVHGIGPAR